MTLFLSNLLRPFFVLLLSAVVLLPARRAVIRHAKEGKLKDFLLFRVSGVGGKWTPKLVVFWALFAVVYLGVFVYIAIP
jgi:hypothetical protein